MGSILVDGNSDKEIKGNFYLQNFFQPCYSNTHLLYVGILFIRHLGNKIVIAYCSNYLLQTLEGTSSEQ